MQPCPPLALLKALGAVFSACSCRRRLASSCCARSNSSCARAIPPSTRASLSVASSSSKGMDAGFGCGIRWSAEWLIRLPPGPLRQSARSTSGPYEEIGHSRQMYDLVRVGAAPRERHAARRKTVPHGCPSRASARQLHPGWLLQPCLCVQQLSGGSGRMSHQGCACPWLHAPGFAVPTQGRAWPSGDPLQKGGASRSFETAVSSS